MDPTANEAQIKEAYYAMVKKYHPDRHHSPHFEDLHGLLEDLMVKVTAAYQLLSTPADRTQYDRTLRSNEASSGQSAFVDDPDVTTSTPEEMAEKHYREGNRHLPLVQTGRRGPVVVVREAGIGKSRPARDLETWKAGPAHREKVAA